MNGLRLRSESRKLQRIRGLTPGLDTGLPVCYILGTQAGRLGRIKYPIRSFYGLRLTGDGLIIHDNRPISFSEGDMTEGEREIVTKLNLISFQLIVVCTLLGGILGTTCSK